jgi:hypothetical protein
VAPILQTFKQNQTVKVGKVALDCDYCSKEWAQRYLYAVNLMRKGKQQLPAVAMGSDFNGVIHHVGPRFAKAVFAEYKTENKIWDFNNDGLAHIGLLPDFIQDLKNIGLTDEDLAPLFRAAEAYVYMWERIDTGQLPVFSAKNR